MDLKEYNLAIAYYSNPLSPEPSNGIIIKYCQVRVGLLEDLISATKVRIHFQIARN